MGEKTETVRIARAKLSLRNASFEGWKEVGKNCVEKMGGIVRATNKNRKWKNGKERNREKKRCRDGGSRC